MTPITFTYMAGGYRCNQAGDMSGEYVPAAEALNASQEIRVRLCEMLGLDYCVDKDMDIYHAIAMLDTDITYLKADIQAFENVHGLTFEREKKLETEAEAGITVCIDMVFP